MRTDRRSFLVSPARHFFERLLNIVYPNLSYMYLSPFSCLSAEPRYLLQAARANAIYDLNALTSQCSNYIHFLNQDLSTALCDNRVSLHLRYNLWHVINLNSSTGFVRI